MLPDGRGGAVHLAAGWLVPGRNPFGRYLFREDVDAVAAVFAGEIIEREAPSAGHGAWPSSRTAPTTC